jgi:inosine-uridine nucleoside N-ribohydrolase
MGVIARFGGTREGAVERRKILIDCDPGHDDAVAILYAARHLDLLGVSTVHGNNTLANVTRNAGSVLALGGIDLAVAAGCGESLLGVAPRAAEAHGGTGLDGAALPPPARPVAAAHAVEMIIETARAHRGELVLAVLGPATNIAVALRREPRLAGWLGEITVMGGSAGRGNVGAVVEYNVACDPEAAAALFACGAPIRMVGYDITSVTGASAADLARLRAGGRVARAIADLLGFYLARQEEYFGLEIAPLHDVCAIVPHVRPDLLDYRRCHVAVELSGKLTRGMTVCDLRTLTPAGRGLRGAGAENAALATGVRARALVEHVLDTLLAYP